MNRNPLTQVYLNPRGLDHSGGVGIWSNNVAKSLVSRNHFTFVEVPGIRSRNHNITRMSEQFLMPVKLRKKDLLLSLSNWGPIIENQILILHDIAPLVHPEYFEPKYVRYANFMLPRLLKRVRKIATVSEFSKGEISKFFHIDSTKIEVLGSGSSLENEKVSLLPDIRQSFSISSPYCLFLGGHDLRKNLAFLVQIWPTIFGQTEMKLLVTNAANPALKMADETRFVSGIEFLGHVNPSELRGLIENATLLLSPSRYEGFGIPIVEALSLGTPVISTATGAAAEILNSGLRVLPLDEDIWINNILNPPSRPINFLIDSWATVSGRLEVIIEELT